MIGHVIDPILSIGAIVALWVILLCTIGLMDTDA